MRVGSGNFWQFLRRAGGATSAAVASVATDVANARTVLGLGALAIKNTIATADIDNDAVTYAKIQNVSATSRLLGRTTAGAGDVEEITPATAFTLFSKLAQRQVSSTATYLTCGTIMPNDNTIPQITEGDEVLTATITPFNAASTLRMTFTGFVGGSGNQTISTAVFVDATANALNATSAAIAGAGSITCPLLLVHEESAGSTLARTYRIRVGSSIATDVFINGDSGSRLFGGVAKATFVVEEYLP